MYRKVYAIEGKEPVFPQEYYQSSVLGTVDVVDCLMAEQVAGLELFAPPVTVEWEGAAFTWAAFPRPADFLTRRLLPSARARLWDERFGSDY
ncbi:hypothetical protein WJX81_008618 [Elliptochloris bilobata]|uniref:Uncharacterized protein n=1 Tax=Elliptochloris bilobata TaxID=381761 RepID=A0AAW1R3N3_9CHLO